MVLCASCGRENREGRKFCVGCGQSLAVELTCPSCGAPYEPDESFCGDCGTALVAAPAVAPTPRRSRWSRNAGSSRSCSPISSASRRFRSRVTRRRCGSSSPATSTRAGGSIGLYGGVVEKFIGDAVMAVWGTPVATEDDAERAVRTALDLVAAVQALGQEAGVDGLAGTRRSVDR